jgi:hypothetical protein
MFDPRVKRILDGHIKPGPEQVLVRQNSALEMMLAQPLELGSGRSPFTVLLAKDLHSEVLNLLRIKVQAFVKANNGRLPEGGEWTQVVDINNRQRRSTHGTTITLTAPRAVGYRRGTAPGRECALWGRGHRRTEGADGVCPGLLHRPDLV